MWMNVNGSNGPLGTGELTRGWRKGIFLLWHCVGSGDNLCFGVADPVVECLSGGGTILGPAFGGNDAVHPEILDKLSIVVVSVPNIGQPVEILRFRLASAKKTRVIKLICGGLLSLHPLPHNRTAPGAHRPADFPVPNI